MARSLRTQLSCLIGIALLAACLPGFAVDIAVGKLTITRDVEATKAPFDKDVWTSAKQNQFVYNGQKVHTQKRAMAEISFSNESTLLRINERTVLKVFNAAQMRKIQLDTGSVWVRVQKGANTTIETPTCTATTYGTVFIFSYDAIKQLARLVVMDGHVEFRTSSGQVRMVGPGQYSEHQGAGTSPTQPQTIPQEDLPVELGGTVVGWWSSINTGVEVSTTAGTNVGDDLRTINENFNTNSPSLQSGFIADATARADFLSLVNQNPGVAGSHSIAEAIGTWIDGGTGRSLSGVTTTYGASTPLITLGGPTVPVSQVNPSLNGLLDSSQLSQLENIRSQYHITTVGELVNALSANGASIPLNLGVPFSRQAAYKINPATSSFHDIRTIDRTDSSTAYLLGGMIASLAADRGNWKPTMPSYAAYLYGFTGSPGFLAQRAAVRGLIGKTVYTMEENAIKYVGYDPTARLDSVLYIEHPIADKWTAFAGRKRFYHGPVFQGLLATQLIGDRYSGIGVHTDQGRWALETALLYDANPEQSGAQRGGLATGIFRFGGGMVGLHLLDNGTYLGRTLSASFPVIRNKVDAYAEYGKGADKATLLTFGTYWPWLYQKTDVDLYLEYGSHTEFTVDNNGVIGTGKAFSVIAMRQIRDWMQARVYSNTVNGTTTAGVGLVFAIGNLNESGANGVLK